MSSTARRLALTRCHQKLGRRRHPRDPLTLLAGRRSVAERRTTTLTIVQASRRRRLAGARRRNPPIARRPRCQLTSLAGRRSIAERRVGGSWTVRGEGSSVVLAQGTFIRLFAGRVLTSRGHISSTVRNCAITQRRLKLRRRRNRIALARRTAIRRRTTKP